MENKEYYVRYKYKGTGEKWYHCTDTVVADNKKEAELEILSSFGEAVVKEVKKEELETYYIILKYKQDNYRELVEKFRDKGIELELPHALVLEGPDEREIKNIEIKSDLDSRSLNDHGREVLDRMIEALKEIREEV